MAAIVPQPSAHLAQMPWRPTAETSPARVLSLRHTQGEAWGAVHTTSRNRRTRRRTRPYETHARHTSVLNPEPCLRGRERSRTSMWHVLRPGLARSRIRHLAGPAVARWEITVLGNVQKRAARDWSPGAELAQCICPVCCESENAPYSKPKVLIVGIAMFNDKHHRSRPLIFRTHSFIILISAS
ncbi:hypothetical protein BD311DRAFT_114752 [Dichomitus squalens]|uniref:Uncharacterized protein n=1 Tax=Dichomitus squalens TaxID=114155 RepID=A0A4Q9M9J4_9APHY|nr:hypothetical protein BD311DRAFT_114752 [Dichomitus squalens]